MSLEATGYLLLSVCNIFWYLLEVNIAWDYVREKEQLSQAAVF